MIAPLLVLLTAAPARAQIAPLERAREEVRSSFLTQAPDAPLAGASVPLPGQDEETRALRRVVGAVDEVQRGCARPCASPEAVAAYRDRVERAAAALALSPDEAQAAVAHYLPDGRPRLRAGDPGVLPPEAPGTPGAQPLTAVQRAGYERSRAMAEAAAGRQDASLRAATASAGAWNRPAGPGDPPPASASRALPPAAAATGMPAQRLAQLNRPSGYQTSLRDLTLAAPPPPAAAAPSAPPPASRAPDEESHPDGLIARSKAYWDRVGSDPNTGVAGRATAAVAVSLFKMFNLDGFEDSAFRLSSVAADPDSTKMQVVKAGGAVAGNTALAMASFVPAAVVAKPVAAVADATKLTKAAEWVGTAAKGLLRAKPEALAAAGTDAERVAQLQAKIAAGTPLSKEEAVWLGEATKGKGGVIFHTTDAVDAIRDGGRLAGTTEGRVYASRRAITSMWRQFLSGVKPKEGTVLLQGKAADLFSSHEATGFYSGMKRLAGQQITNGKGDIVITKAFYDAETKTLTVTEARMVTEGEKKFLLQSKGFAASRLWGRRVVLDPLLTGAVGFIAAPNKPAVFDYVLGDPSAK